MDFLEELRKITSQDAKSQIRNETSEFDVENQRVERDLVERGFDYILGRGEAIQEEARKKYVKDLKAKAESRDVDPADLNITSKTTSGALNKLVKDYKTADQQTTLALQTGQTGGKTREEIMAMSPSERGTFLQEALRKKRTVDVETDPATIRLENQDKENTRRYNLSEAREARRDKENTRRYDLKEQRLLADRVDAREATLMDLQFRKQQEANRMAMFDKRLAADQKLAKREKMAGIIAGLANLGAAFAI